MVPVADLALAVAVEQQDTPPRYRAAFSGTECCLNGVAVEVRSSQSNLPRRRAIVAKTLGALCARRPPERKCTGLVAHVLIVIRGSHRRFANDQRSLACNKRLIAKYDEDFRGPYWAN